MIRPKFTYTRSSQKLTACPKDPAPVKDERYRRLVVSLPCFECRIETYSQAAHPNTNKAKGKKACDLQTFPMCSVAGNDCHARFDQYKLVRRVDMPDYEKRAVAWTVKQLKLQGVYPAKYKEAA